MKMINKKWWNKGWGNCMFKWMTVLSLSLLMMLSPLHAEMVDVGILVDFSFVFGQKWGEENAITLDRYEALCKEEGFFDALHGMRITKILKLPDLKGFRPSENTDNSINYIDLESGEYKESSFNRHWGPRIINFNGVRYYIWYIKLDETEVNTINEGLIYYSKPEKQCAPPDPGPIEQQGPDITNLPLDEPQEVSGDKMYLKSILGGAGVIAILVTGGLGLYVRHKRKAEEKKKGEAGKRGFWQKLIRTEYKVTN
jgi:hypothetical protein